MTSLGEPRDEWESRLAVVTGASSGIGQSTTEALLQRGCDVVALDVDATGLSVLEGDLSSYAGALTSYVLDVADWSAVSKLGAEILEQHGVPDFLVANAGINPPAASSADIDERFFDRVLDVNLKGIFACNRAFLPAMAERRSGTVVNLASVSGLISWGGTSVYSASKGGVIALTRFLAAEYAPQGVRVNCVCPGSVRTPMVLNNMQRFADAEERLEKAAHLHPLNRIAEAHEIADTILFLLSDRSSFVTGIALTVDGGLSAV